MRVIVRSVLALGLVSWSAPAWTQTEPVDVVAEVSRLVTLRGPAADQGGDTVNVCAVNIGRRAATAIFMLRDAEVLDTLLSMARVELEPGQGSCHAYTESSADARRVVAFATTTSRFVNNWTSSDTLQASLWVAGPSGEVRAYEQLERKVVTLPASIAAAAEARDDATLAARARARPRPAQVAGPLPVRGATLTDEADVVELCALNLGGEPAGLRLEIRDAFQLDDLFTSSNVTLEPGGIGCVSHPAGEGATAPVLTVASAIESDVWVAIGRDVVMTTGVRNPSGAGFLTEGSAARVVLPPSP
jgi:hypothetical protein